MSTISVVIPLYNKEKSISKTIESVINQKFPDFEIVIIDDGSTDNSVSVVQSFSDDRVVVYRKENGGVSSARNYGVEKAKSKWIVFLDADDIMLPENLNTLLTLQKKYNCDVATANFYKETNKNSTKIFLKKNIGDWIIKDNIKSYYFNHFSMRMGCFLARKEDLLNNRFDENFSRYEDLAFILKFIVNKKIATTATPILIYTAEYRDASKADILKKYKRDFTYNMVFENKNIWEKLILGELIYLASLKESQKSLLKNIYKQRVYYGVFSGIGLKIKKIIRYF